MDSEEKFVGRLNRAKKDEWEAVWDPKAPEKHQWRVVASQKESDSVCFAPFTETGIGQGFVVKQWETEDKPGKIFYEK